MKKPESNRSSNRGNRRLRFENLQSRQLMAIDLGALLKPGDLPTYSIDGTGNNVAKVKWGSTGEDQLRLANPEYSDGIATPAGSDRPSARLISNTISDQGDSDIISRKDLSAFVYAWGQFIDHDISLTPTGNSESFDISVPKGDAYFDPASTATKVIGMTRSLYDTSTGTTTTNPRQQYNSVTSWMDGSMIYGSDSITSKSLRTLSGGKLKMDNQGLLPLNNQANFPDGPVNQANIPGGVPDDGLFAAGDVRANENIELTSLHTVFVREHNRWADRIAKLNPNLNDQELYIRARAVVIAEIQSITYNEWLPAVVAGNAMPRYTGYKPQVNPNLSNEFSTAAFRFGHSLLGNDIKFLDENGIPVADEVALKDAFFRPTLLNDHSLESIFKYLASDPASEMDTKLVGSLRNFLFGPPGSGGFDLAALNIQRGRDHGLADYNDTRAALGLPKVKSFAEISKNPQLQANLKQLYTTVGSIDLWVGILAEDPLPGSNLGPTGQKIIIDQFLRMRDGDRFWYQNEFGGSLLREIEQTRLSDILKRNASMNNLQNNVFFFHASIGGRVVGEGTPKSNMAPPPQGLAGYTIELRTSEGLVATTLTDLTGRYRFDVQSGLRTGQYSVSIVKTPDGRSVHPVAKTTAITRGDQFALLDLTLPLPPTGPTRQPNGLAPGGQ